MALLSSLISNVPLPPPSLPSALPPSQQFLLAPPSSSTHFPPLSSAKIQQNFRCSPTPKMRHSVQSILGVSQKGGGKGREGSILVFIWSVSENISCRNTAPTANISDCNSNTSGSPKAFKPVYWQFGTSPKAFKPVLQQRQNLGPFWTLCELAREGGRPSME